ncbi:MAG TPA: STAS domain-containing protein [Methylomirabilota bacterium]
MPLAGTMGLEIEITEVGNGGRCVALRGRLDSQTAPMLDERLELVLPSASALLFDMAGLEYISSAGIRVLVKARKALEARGGGMAVAHLQPLVRQVIDILKAVPSIDIFTDDAQMDAFIERRQRRQP